MPANRPCLDTRMPRFEFTKAARRDDESIGQARQDYSGLGLLRHAPAERGVRGRLDERT